MPIVQETIKVTINTVAMDSKGISESQKMDSRYEWGWEEERKMREKKELMSLVIDSAFVTIGDTGGRINWGKRERYAQNSNFNVLSLRC